MADGAPRTDEQVDRLLRDAGARLRDTASAPLTASPEPERVPHRRWILPVSIGALAAASVALVVALSGQGQDTIQQVPADTAPPVVPDGTGPATTGTATTTSSTAATESPAVTVSDVGWDGDASACVTIDSVTGCFPGDTIRPAGEGGTTAHVLTDTGAWRIVVTGDGDDPAASASADGAACPGDVDYRRDAWLLVACGTGDAALWDVLPAAPGDPVGHEAFRSAARETVALSPMGDGSVLRAYQADVDASGVVVHCLLVVPDPTGWYESCAVPSGPAHPGTRLLVHDGVAYVVDPLAGRIAVLGDAPVRTNGCDAPAREVAASLGGQVMVGGLACDGAAATVSFGSAFVQEGSVDGGLVALERDPTGAWQVVDSGTGIEPDPPPLALAPVDLLLLDAGTPAGDVADVTTTVRGWRDERPDLSIADAIAAGSGDPVENLPTDAMAPLPSLTVVEVSYADDSVGGARYAVWTTEPDDGSDPLMVAFMWALCTRGVTEVDGQAVCT